ncbi:MAG: DUF2683 family protein [Candidatus Diapherotrites archaeon]|nr:DUF2683 family protein [Candidatus Diapherotrites archaeon]
MVDARVSLNKYSSQVLSVVKARYDLRDKSAALNKFVELYGVNELEPEVDEQYVKKILSLEGSHLKKYGQKHTSFSDLRKIVEGD